MRILFIGDIVGRTGRHAVQNRLPELRTKLQVDVVVANAENAAGGLGATPDLLAELRKAGIDLFTMGNHTWRKRVLIGAIDNLQEVVRPANYAVGTPGRGAALFTLPDGRKLGVTNLLGRVFMEPQRCPFLVGTEMVEQLRQETPVILVDMHAEATSEKVAMGWHMDGQCTAVVGTHTHIQTADEWILPQGTAYITDVGMCGPLHSVIGTEVDPVVEKFLTGMPREFNVARGPAIFAAVLIDANDETGQATHIERLLLRDQ